jgi:hypothetical protein
MSLDLQQLDVFYGELTPNRAYVYARLPRPIQNAGLTLSGHVRGPRCLSAQTLPSVAPLVDLGAGPTLLARAAVMEPCFWSSDLPAIYDVVVNLQCGNEVLSSVRREIGLRSLGVRGPRFSLAGKPWVLRGVVSSSTTAKLPREWHDANAAFVVPSFYVESTDEQLAEASQFGALTVIEMARGQAGIRNLRQISAHPAVAMAVGNQNMSPDISKKEVSPNILLAQRIDAEDPVARQPWADLLLTTTTDPDLLTQISQLGELPIIVVRPLDSPIAITEARAACDQLQRDLAPVGQFAGYIV